MAISALPKLPPPDVPWFDANGRPSEVVYNYFRNLDARIRQLPGATNGVTVANLPTGSAGDWQYVTNGRKNGEGAGSGTGVYAFKDGTAWRAVDTGATVAA